VVTAVGEEGGMASSLPRGKRESQTGRVRDLKELFLYNVPARKERRRRMGLLPSVELRKRRKKRGGRKSLEKKKGRRNEGCICGHDREGAIVFIPLDTQKKKEREKKEMGGGRESTPPLHVPGKKKERNEFTSEYSMRGGEGKDGSVKRRGEGSLAFPF